jgi:hypothetical protein
MIKNIKIALITLLISSFLSSYSFAMDDEDLIDPMSKEVNRLNKKENNGNYIAQDQENYRKDNKKAEEELRKEKSKQILNNRYDINFNKNK